MLLNSWLMLKLIGVGEEVLSGKVNIKPGYCYILFYLKLFPLVFASFFPPVLPAGIEFLGYFLQKEPV